MCTRHIYEISILPRLMISLILMGSQRKEGALTILGHAATSLLGWVLYLSMLLEYYILNVDLSTLQKVKPRLKTLTMLTAVTSSTSRSHQESWSQNSPDCVIPNPVNFERFDLQRSGQLPAPELCRWYINFPCLLMCIVSFSLSDT